jgi:hypothetical protein
VRLVTWNDGEGDSKTLNLFPVLGVGLGLAYFFGGYRVVASLWVRDHGPDTVWWPLFGAGSMIGVFVAILGSCGLVLLLKRWRTPRPTALVVLSAVLSVAVGAVAVDSRQRVEIVGDQVSIGHHDGTIRTYGPADIATVSVGCLQGRRGSPRTAIVLRARDGGEIDLAELDAVAWNGPPRGDWLTAVEAVTDASRRRGVWRIERQPSGRPNLNLACVNRFAERFPADDRGRVVRLFTA